MSATCLLFIVHLPRPLRRYTVFDRSGVYFDEHRSAQRCKDFAQSCCLPLNRLFLDAARSRNGGFRATFCLTGPALEQFEGFCPEALASFQALHRNAPVEFVSEPYHHGPVFWHSPGEFAAQLDLHRVRMAELFGKQPVAWLRLADVRHLTWPFWNGRSLCFEGLPLAGAAGDLFSDHETPTPIVVDYATLWRCGRPATDAFGELLGFLRNSGTGAEAEFAPFSQNCPGQSWSDKPPISPRPLDDEAQDDAPPWLINPMQADALHHLFEIEKTIKICSIPEICHAWRTLQGIDYLFSMDTNELHSTDGGSPRTPSPYESYIAFMNILEDIRGRLFTAGKTC